MTLPPPPPIRTDAVVIDLRRDAPPPPGRPAPVIVGDGSEIWIRIDLDDPATPSLHAVPPPVDRDPPSYPLQLIRDEPIPLGLRRVSVGRLDAAVAGLRGAVRTNADVRPIAAALDCVRSVLRGVRTWVGEDVYRAENAVLGCAIDALQQPATARERLSQANHVAAGVIGGPGEAELIGALQQEDDEAYASSIGDRQHATDLIVTIAAARSRFASWPVHPGMTEESRKRVPIPDAFSSIAGGLEDSYRLGKEAMAAGLEQPLPPELVRWREEARRLRHQLELIVGAWPEMLGGVVATLETLDHVLSTERAYGDLGWRVTTPPWPLASEADQHTLVLELERRRFRLRRRAFALGRRMYLESPEALIGRLSGYWSLWRLRSS